MLNTVTYGDRDTRPLLIVHGLYGSARNWGVIAKRLSSKRRVLVVDMRNHGESGWFESHTYRDLAADLSAVISAHGGIADVVGHSMGGKASMMLALTEPHLVNSLVVADIAPVAYSHDNLQYIRAMSELALEGLTSRSAAEAQFAAILSDRDLRAFLLQSLDFRTTPPRWKLNLMTLEREMEHIIGWPEVGGQYDNPTLFLTGGNSDYVQQQHRPLIRGLFPKAWFAKLPDAGHWLHAEKPREFEASVDAFLARVDGTSA